MRASSPLIANEASRERTRVRVAKHLLSRAALGWFLAAPPNGGLACKLIYYVLRRTAAHHDIHEAFDKDSQEQLNVTITCKISISSEWKR